jgi:hypothetical protein
MGMSVGMGIVWLVRAWACYENDYTSMSMNPSRFLQHDHLLSGVLVMLTPHHPRSTALLSTSFSAHVLFTVPLSYATAEYAIAISQLPPSPTLCFSG